MNASSYGDGGQQKEGVEGRTWIIKAPFYGTESFESTSGDCKLRNLNKLGGRTKGGKQACPGSGNRETDTMP